MRPLPSRYPAAPAAFDHAWHCLPRTDFEKFEVHEAGLVLDYLLVREEKGTLSGLPVVTFSYSVVNKLDRNIHIDAQLVGLAADGTPVLGDQRLAALVACRLAGLAQCCEQCLYRRRPTRAGSKALRELWRRFLTAHHFSPNGRISSSDDQALRGCR